MQIYELTGNIVLKMDSTAKNYSGFYLTSPDWNINCPH